MTLSQRLLSVDVASAAATSLRHMPRRRRLLGKQEGVLAGCRQPTVMAQWLPSADRSSDQTGLVCWYLLAGSHEASLSALHALEMRAAWLSIHR